MQDYRTISLVIAALALVSGFLLIAAPGILIKAGEVLNRVYNLESVVYKQRQTFGAIFILGGLAFLYFLW